MKTKTFLPYQIVVFDPQYPHEDYPFKKGELLLFLGEIPNMPEHCAIGQWKTWKLFWGYHTEDFREPTDDEL